MAESNRPTQGEEISEPQRFLGIIISLRPYTDQTSKGPLTRFNVRIERGEDLIKREIYITGLDTQTLDRIRFGQEVSIEGAESTLKSYSNISGRPRTHKVIYSQKLEFSNHTP